MAVPQFGDPEPGRAYPDRPAAFAVIERDGLIAVVRVDEPLRVARSRRGEVLDLPGGGIDPGESALAAAIRECGEEAGLIVDLEPEPFVRADHFFVNGKGDRHNTRGAFFAGRVAGEDPVLKIEDDHTLVWMAPCDALAGLDREAHAWAVAAWLRRRRWRAGA